MTIDGLNALTTLTAGDELPVWDVEASAEEPTKKITAQNMAASVKTLGSLVNTSEMNSALAGKQNTLTFDTTPTTGSTNPVTSGGVADAIQQSMASAETKLSGQLSANVTGWADYIKFGKIVLVQFVLSNTAELSSGTRFITGIPKPDRLYTVGDYKFFNMSAYFRVGDDGSIITGNVIATNTTIRGSACYISA